MIKGIFQNELIKEYLPPVRVVAKSNNVSGEECLLTNRSRQIFTKEEKFLSCKGKGYVILDFGQELCGGIRLLAYRKLEQKIVWNYRFRFGESVGETCAEIGEKNATNHHATRDMLVAMPGMSDQEWGQTGFRFVRIDFLDEDVEYRIVNIYAAFTHRDLVYRGDFECDDELVTQIYRTARDTIFLNMQENLLEGIKRDRLVWIGDMQPEVLAITDIFGADKCVEDAIRLSVEKNPLPCWFGNIPTYSFWLIQILYDYYIKTKRATFVREYLPYVQGVLEQLDACLTETGDIDYSLLDVDAREGYFLDWPTYGTKDAKEGNRFVFIITIKNLKRLYLELGLPENPLCDSLLTRLYLPIQTAVFAKQIVALGYLANRIDGCETAEKLTAGGAKGLSTFMSYFILKAIANSGDIQSAIDIMKEYYGGMLSRGATSFWEDFDVEWLENSGRIDEFTPEGKKDIHGDFGKFCYQGYRHSLCHGWSCGPVQFLVENVLGIEVVKAGCEEIVVTPRLGKLNWCKGVFPTPYGNVKVFHRRSGENIITEYTAPDEIKVTINN